LLATEVGGELKKHFASTASSGNCAAVAAHHAVGDSVHGMTSSLRYATSSTSTAADAVVSNSVAGAPSMSSRTSMGPTLARFAGGAETPVDSVAAGRRGSFYCPLFHSVQLVGRK